MMDMNKKKLSGGSTLAILPIRRRRSWPRSAFRSRFVMSLALVIVTSSAGGNLRFRSGAFASALQRLSEPVSTEAGLIRGEILDSSIVYRGIPYAAPPIGDLRWRSPQSHSPWEGTRDTLSFGPRCPQFTGPNGSVLLPGQPGVYTGSEDCLSLNVWAAKAQEISLRPVMVFIHGGGNTQGASSEAVYDGRKLAETGGVAVVTINYRLGQLGYLAHPRLSAEDPEHHSSGNYGLLDQILALHWVQRNIRNFGGDPGNVTIFGESAGGLAVSCLLASPLAAGLFHRAIIESGGYTITTRLRDLPNATQPESAEEFGLRFAKVAGCDTSPDPAACLRSKTAEQIVSTLRADPGILDRFMGGTVYGPNVDGYVITDSPLSVMAAGKQSRVPVMIGTNQDEGSIFVLQVPLNTEAAYRAAVQRFLSGISSQVLARYPVSDYASPRKAFEAIVSDAAFICPARTATQTLAVRQPRVFVYQFRHGLQSPLLGFLGAYHGLELAYVFGNFGAITPSADEIQLSEAMISYWTAFARNGDPNRSGLPGWPAYNLEGDMHVILDTTISTGSALRKEFCDFWNQVLSGRKISNGSVHGRDFQDVFFERQAGGE